MNVFFIKFQCNVTFYKYCYSLAQVQKNYGIVLLRTSYVGHENITFIMSDHLQPKYENYTN